MLHDVNYHQLRLTHTLMIGSTIVACSLGAAEIALASAVKSMTTSADSTE